MQLPLVSVSFAAAFLSIPSLAYTHYSKETAQSSIGIPNVIVIYSRIFCGRSERHIVRHMAKPVSAKIKCKKRRRESIPQAEFLPSADRFPTVLNQLQRTIQM